LKPFKVRDLLPSFAMEINASVDVVQAVMSLYYKCARKKLSELNTVNLQLENLGTFYIKEKALDKTIINYEQYINKLSDINIKDYETKLDVRKKIDAMVHMKSLLDEERQRRRLVINKRFNNELTEEHNSDMEE